MTTKRIHLSPEQDIMERATILSGHDGPALPTVLQIHRFQCYLDEMIDADEMPLYLSSERLKQDFGIDIRQWEYLIYVAEEYLKQYSNENAEYHVRVVTEEVEDVEHCAIALRVHAVDLQKRKASRFTM